MMSEPYSLPESQFGEIVQESLFVEERRSRGYISLMERIQVAMDQFELSEINMDLRDIENRRGCLIYFETSGIPVEIPYDIEYLPKLSHGLRKVLIDRLEAIRGRLSMRHRRLLRHMRFLHNWEHITGITRFDVERRVVATLEEIERYKKLAKVAVGANQLCILRDALLLPARTHFELVSTRQALRDKRHPGHGEAMDWLRKSRFSGKMSELERFINKAFKQLSDACDSIYDQVETLTGISFSRDLGQQDETRAWYGLGAAVDREDDALAGVDLRALLERQSFEDIRRSWSPDYFEDRRKKLDAIAREPRQKAEGLTRLFYELQRKIVDAPKPDGAVHLAIASDLRLGLINQEENEEARNWVLENWLQLAGLFENVFEELSQIAKENPNMGLAEDLEQCFNKVRSDNFRNRKALQRELEHRLKDLSMADVREELEDFDLENTVADAHDVKTLLTLHEVVKQKAETISVGDVALLRRFRLAWEWSECEKRLAELYHLNDELEEARIRLERLIFSGYRKLDSFLSLSDEQLRRCLEIVVHHMYTGLKLGDYRDIDIEGFQKQFKQTLKQEPAEALIRLDFLLQEIQAIPEATWLIGALESWQTKLGPEEIRKRSAFLLENEELRRGFEGRIRAELKKRLALTDRESRRVRFEVWGFGSSLAENLSRRLDIVTTQLPKLTSISDADSFARDLSSLEDRILQAQKSSKPGKECSRRVIELEHQGEINHNMAGKLHQDLEENYRDLEKVMKDAGQAVRMARRHQVRFGREQDLEYLGMTLQLDDIEALRGQYGFLEDLTMEDLKRYCLAHRVVTEFMDDLMAKCRQEDKTVHPEILSHYTRKSFANYFGQGQEKRRRALSRRLKAAILRNNPAILEAESHRLLLWLNFADPRNLSRQDTYRNFVKLFELVEQRDDAMNRSLLNIWKKMRNSLMASRPETFTSNFEHNRRCFITEIDELIQD